LDAAHDGGLAASPGAEEGDAKGEVGEVEALVERVGEVGEFEGVEVSNLEVSKELYAMTGVVHELIGGFRDHANILGGSSVIVGTDMKEVFVCRGWKYQGPTNTHERCVLARRREAVI